MVGSRSRSKCLRDRNGELAAGKEIRRLTRDRRQVGLGQSMKQAVLLEGTKHTLDGIPAVLPLYAASRLSSWTHTPVARETWNEGR